MAQSEFVFELVFFDINIQPHFCWYVYCSIAYDRAISRRCTWCRRPQRGHECATALFQASHHSERDGNRLERPNSLFHSSKRWYRRTLRWKQAVGFLNKHSAALHYTYKCSWCSLRILPARRLIGRRRFGIRSRCALPAVSVTRRGLSLHVRAHLCEPAQAVGDLHQQQTPQSSHLPRLAFVASPGKHRAQLQRPLATLLPMSFLLIRHFGGSSEREEFRSSSSLAFGKQF